METGLTGRRPTCAVLGAEDAKVDLPAVGSGSPPDVRMAPFLSDYTSTKRPFRELKIAREAEESGEWRSRPSAAT